MNHSEIADFVRGIAQVAKRNGNDLLTIEPMGPKTLITCEKRMSVNKEPWTEELDVAFSDLEFTALEALRGDSHWDVRFTSAGLRAFGKQWTGVDAITTAPNRPKQAPVTAATKFQPFSWRRDDYKSVGEKEMTECDFCPFPCY